jgi:hypothetical protein
MKITESQLREIIKEEAHKLLHESRIMIHDIYKQSELLYDDLQNATSAAVNGDKKYPYHETIEMADDFIQVLVNELDQFPYGFESHLMNFENATKLVAELLRSDKSMRYPRVSNIGSRGSARYFKDMNRYLLALQRIIENVITDDSSFQ